MSKPKNQLAAVAEQLKQWRKTKEYNNTPIPEPLRKQIIALFEFFGVSELQSVLNMSSSLLYRWVKESCDVVKTPVAVPSSAKDPEFVTLPTAQDMTTGHILLELSLDNQCQVRLSGDISVQQLDVVTRNIFMYQQGGAA